MVEDQKKLAAFINKVTNNNTGGVVEVKWRSIRDNLRNFFLSPPAEMLSFLQQLEVRH